MQHNSKRRYVGIKPYYVKSNHKTQRLLYLIRYATFSFVWNKNSFPSWSRCPAPKLYSGPRLKFWSSWVEIKKTKKHLRAYSALFYPEYNNEWILDFYFIEWLNMYHQAKHHHQLQKGIYLKHILFTWFEYNFEYLFITWALKTIDFYAIAFKRLILHFGHFELINRLIFFSIMCDIWLAIHCVHHIYLWTKDRCACCTLWTSVWT